MIGALALSDRGLCGVVDAIVGLFSVARFAGNLEADCAALRILQKRIGLDDDELRMLEKLYRNR